MIELKTQNAYKAFGLTIVSTIPIPELPKLDVSNEDFDIVIKKMDLTKIWLENAEPNRNFLVKESYCLFQIPNTAIYLVEDGKKVFYSPIEGSSDDQIRLFLLGTCMGAILMQRKILPLHGSAVAIDGKCYAIVGDSGAGKSTLATALLSKGYQLLSDDLIPITLSEENIPIVTPAYPQQKLWLESLDQFGMVSEQYRPIFDRETKFAVPVPSQFAGESLPLAGVFELIKSDSETIEVRPIQKLERFHTLYKHTYRNFFINKFGLIDWHFSTCAKMVNKIELFQLNRPSNRFTAHDLTECILNTIKKEN
ncbi:HPr kinase/phosphorylase [Gottfriedia solisilvae]|uniref:HPr kinase/phosphorylase n=1 Tax=Gottfriedia solisilvae TaxID=1516104 RepID=UPI003D2E9E13